jgi:putative Holliday junction resolvase
MVNALSVTTITSELRQMLRGRRIGALDYGRKRIGFAIADEMHILATPRGIFHNTPRVVEEICAVCEQERLGCLVVGMPIQHDDTQTAMMLEISDFIQRLQSVTPLPIYIADEAYSSREAQQTMIRAGKKKSHRAQKGSTDEVAAAIMLRYFLEELA